MCMNKSRMSGELDLTPRKKIGQSWTCIVMKLSDMKCNEDKKNDAKDISTDISQM